MFGCNVPIEEDKEEIIHNNILQGISADEGFSGKVYKDSKGFLTIGYGFNLDKISIPIEIASEWLRYIIRNVQKELSDKIPFWKELNDARKYVLINMAYQMGIYGLLKFKKMLKALGEKNYIECAEEMKNSTWHLEFSNRSNRLIKIMLSGEF